MGRVCGTSYPASSPHPALPPSGGKARKGARQGGTFTYTSQGGRALAGSMLPDAAVKSAVESIPHGSFLLGRIAAVPYA